MYNVLVAGEVDLEHDMIICFGLAQWLVYPYFLFCYLMNSLTQEALKMSIPVIDTMYLISY